MNEETKGLMALLRMREKRFKKELSEEIEIPDFNKTKWIIEMKAALFEIIFIRNYVEAVIK